MLVATQDPTPEITGLHRARPPIVDCDVHQDIHDHQELRKFLPPAFRHRNIVLPNRAEFVNPYGAGRRDAGSRTYDALKEGYLDPYGIEVPVLTGDEAIRTNVMPDLDYAAAYVRR